MYMHVQKFVRELSSHVSFFFALVSESVHEFGRVLSELEQMARLMILEGLAMDSPCERITYALRIAEYGTRGIGEAMVTMPEHKDPTVITLVCQYQIPGLEISLMDGEWIGVPPSTNSVAILVGEILEACSSLLSYCFQEI